MDNRMSTRVVHLLGLLLAAVGAVTAGSARAVEFPEPAATWTNTGDAAMPVDVTEAPEDPVYVQLGRGDRPYRILFPRKAGGGARLEVPPGVTVQAWNRKEFASLYNNPFGTAAQWAAFPQIVVGPFTLATGDAPGHYIETPAWTEASGRYRAFAEAEFPVTVHVHNTGIGAWNRPRVRLFAPEGWTVTPEVADVISPAKKVASEDAPSITQGERGVLPPSLVGTAAFTVRIPRRTVTGSTAPVVAFLRYEAGGKVVTVQNSVDVTLREPIERRYAMNEPGDRFIVRLINRFTPLALGTPSVEVRRPAGASWTVTPPEPVEVLAYADAAAGVKMAPSDVSPVEQVAVPVVVTLNGLRMGYTPTVYTAAAYGTSYPDRALERGVSLLREAHPVQLTETGVCPAAAEGERPLAFDVVDRFAVSEPAQLLSPTWVTLTFENRGATRLRLEYDAWGSDAPAVAADGPLTAQAGSVTRSFLLPDARFANRLPGRADLVVTTFGGDICLQKVSVSKWNPLKAGG